jgi:hypothetical protein
VFVVPLMAMADNRNANAADSAHYRRRFWYRAYYED